MKRKKLFTICIVLMLLLVVGCNLKDKTGHSDNYSEVTIIEDGSKVLITKENPTINGIIKSDPNGAYGLIIIDDKDNIEYSSLDEDYKVTNNNNKYYKFSIIEYILNCKSSINYQDREQSYNIKLKVSISDPYMLFNNANILNIQKDQYTTKDLFENVLKNELDMNLNKSILKYLTENNLEFNSSLELTRYISDSLDEIIRTKYGIKVISIDLTK